MKTAIERHREKIAYWAGEITRNDLQGEAKTVFMEAALEKVRFHISEIERIRRAAKPSVWETGPDT